MIGWFLLAASLFTTHYETPVEASGDCYVWEVEEAAPFGELLISWNGRRPEEGELLISVSVLEDGVWSPYIPYMRWGSEGQSSIQRSEDQLFRKGGGFCVRVDGPVGCLRALFASASNLEQFDFASPDQHLRSVQLMGVAPVSQMALDHPDHRRLCSPTSTAVAVHYLGGALDPIGIAQGVRDERRDIYGNWVLNAAEASSRLGERWKVYAQRLGSFDELHDQLAHNLPVVVSVKGEIPGGALPYSEGHLMVIVGYDAEKRRVIAIDPAFDSNEEALVSYDLGDFLAVWGVRKNLAYIFDTDRRSFAPADADRGDAAPQTALLQGEGKAAH